MEAEADPGARRLSDQLQEEILQLLEVDVAKKMGEVVKLLNEQGHQLRPYYPEPGHIAFRDDRGSDNAYECDLRVAADIVVSTGFCDTMTDPDEPGGNAGESEVGNPAPRDAR